MKCNQFPEKECYNEGWKRCDVCEFAHLCLCTRVDRPEDWQDFLEDGYKTYGEFKEERLEEKE